MNVAEWATFAATVLGLLGTIATTQFSQAKTRGEFRSLLRNFPLHRHVKVNGKQAIIYPAEYQPPADATGNANANDTPA